jgi:ferredoxin-NADP reductase
MGDRASFAVGAPRKDAPRERFSQPPALTVRPFQIGPVLPQSSARQDDRLPHAPMTQPQQTYSVLVRSATWLAGGVIELCLGRTGVAPLPRWEPGAHIDLILPSGLVRQYSLCGDPAEEGCFRVAVLRELDGRGGSAELHDTQLVGRVLTAQGPRNHFGLVAAPAYRFIAGGIGVTPIIPMIAHAAASQAEWRLLYGARSRDSMAFRPVLERYGPLVEFAPQDEVGFPDLEGFIGAAPAGAAIYCCGPEGMIRAVEAHCLALGRTEHLHLERFAPAVPDPAMPAPLAAGAFEVELRRTGVVITVAPDRTLLDCAREAGAEVPSSCEVGICGACETAILDGLPDHRDGILSAGERAEGKTMMICVSRALSQRLVLDL